MASGDFSGNAQAQQLALLRLPHAKTRRDQPWLPHLEGVGGTGAVEVA